jgi:hypothetical protein
MGQHIGLTLDHSGTAFRRSLTPPLVPLRNSATVTTVAALTHVQTAHKSGKLFGFGANTIGNANVSAGKRSDYAASCLRAGGVTDFVEQDGNLKIRAIRMACRCRPLCRQQQDDDTLTSDVMLERLRRRRTASRLVVTGSF